MPGESDVVSAPRPRSISRNWPSITKISVAGSAVRRSSCTRSWSEVDMDITSCAAHLDDLLRGSAYDPCQIRPPLELDLPERWRRDCRRDGGEFVAEDLDLLPGRVGGEVDRNGELRDGTLKQNKTIAVFRLVEHLGLFGDVGIVEVLGLQERLHIVAQV